MLQRYRKTDALNELHLAIKTNKPDLVIFTLRLHHNLNLNSNLMRTSALSLAVRNQNEVIVRVLLDHGCELNKLSTDESGRLETPLFTAARLLNYKIVELLLVNGADPNVTVSDNRTPLYIATKERSFEICSLLISFGANLDIPDRTGQTPLHLASRNIAGREEIAKLLIAHGANVHAADFKRRLALDFAEMSGCFSLVKMLVDEGSPISKHMKDRVRNKKQTRTESLAGDDRESSLSDHHSEALSVLITKLSEVASLKQLARMRMRNLLRRRVGQRGCSIWPLIDSMTVVPLSLRNFLKLRDSEFL